jgi:hypothetical protein
VIRASVARVDHLAAADAALRHATMWDRPFAFLSHADWGIARATWTIYRPALPTTAEGFLYAAVGMVFILSTYHFCIRAPIARHFQRRRMAQSGAFPATRA